MIIMNYAKIKEIQAEIKVNDVAMANFLGQLHIESNGFKARRESLNYDVKGLIDTFSFFRRNPALAEAYARKQNRPANQVAIANAVYDDKNRDDKHKLGNTQKGDGWKYRGGFGIHTTGRKNYTRLSQVIGDPLILSDPDSVIEKYFFKAAYVYFNDRRLWEMASKAITIDITTLLTKAINGGLKHRDERHEMAKYYFNLITQGK